MLSVEIRLKKGSYYQIKRYPIIETKWGTMVFIFEILKVDIFDGIAIIDSSLILKFFIKKIYL